MHQTVRYPEIPRSESDIYVYTTIGDRYDTLAFQYYSDSTLWWVIANANSKTNKNSLTPPVGTQIRIPANPAITTSNYSEINIATSTTTNTDLNLNNSGY